MITYLVFICLSKQNLSNFKNQWFKIKRSMVFAIWCSATLLLWLNRRPCFHEKQGIYLCDIPILKYCSIIICPWLTWSAKEWPILSSLSALPLVVPNIISLVMGLNSTYKKEIKMYLNGYLHYLLLYYDHFLEMVAYILDIVTRVCLNIEIMSNLIVKIK